MENQNGLLVLQTLQSLDEPSTLNRISKEVAKSIGVKADVIKDTVEQTLNGGVQYGYVQRVDKKYYTDPVELNELVDGLGTNNEFANKADDYIELEDRARRRRRSSSRRRRSGSRRRSRSRSRRRRR